jgi:hypothetical protein
MIAFEGPFATERLAIFIRRIPRQNGRPAVNLLRFPDFAGLHGLDDDGTCEMSDYDLARLGRYASALVG